MHRLLLAPRPYRAWQGAVALGAVALLAVVVPAATAAAAPAGARGARPVLAAKPGPAAVAPRAATAPLAPRAAASTLAGVRAREQRPRTAPRATAPAATYVVTTAADSPLASPTSTSCHDAANGQCSLRAAVEAANNLDRAALIKLGPHTYTLSDSTDGSLEIENAGGTTIQGASETQTKIVVPPAQTYGVIDVAASAGSGGSVLFLNDATLSGGDAAEGGGVLLSDEDDVSAVLDHADVTKNTASSVGGGVYVYYGSLWATDSTISGNTAVDGGGIYDYWGNVYLVRTLVNADVASSATSAGDGGGVYSEYGQLHVTGGSISGDHAGTSTEEGYGGGIYDEYGSDDLGGNVALSHDTVMDDGVGGAEYLEYARLSAVGVSYRYDKATGGATAQGGALAAYYGSDVELGHVSFTDDTTSSTDYGDGGGALYDYGESDSNLLTATGCTFAGDDSSAVVLYAFEGGVSATIDGSRFDADSSTAEYAGAAVNAYVDEYGGVSVTLDGDQLANNKATGEYASGAVELYSEYYSGSTLSMAGDTLVGNRATSTEGTGAISADAVEYSSVTTSVTGSKLIGDQAPDAGYGGAVYVTSDDDDINSTLLAAGDTFLKDSAGSSTHAGYGGAIMLYDYVQGQVTGSTLDDDTAIGGATGAAGGAVYDASYLGSAYVGDTMEHDRATGASSDGGALFTYPYDGAGLLAQSTIASNTATYGAGISLEYYGLNVANSTIDDNVAGSTHDAGYGGGIYVYDSALSVMNSTITGNAAVSGGGKHGQGGGVYYYDGGNEAFDFSTIDGNSASQGGGLYNDADPGVLRGTIVAQNHATLRGGAPENCMAYAAKDRLVSAGGNVLGAPGCVFREAQGDVTAPNPRVGPLAHNGGPTETMALLAKSPALGAVGTGCPTTDQRGAARPVTGCDTGAYQHALAKKH